MNSLKRIFFLAALMTASFSFSQSTEKSRGAATMDANYCVTLDNTIPLQEYYIADATPLGWTSEEHAKKMCGFHSNNLVWFTPDYANNKMLIHIYVDRTYEPRDFAWWNEYLISICE